MKKQEIIGCMKIDIGQIFVNTFVEDAYRLNWLTYMSYKDILKVYTLLEKDFFTQENLNNMFQQVANQLDENLN